MLRLRTLGSIWLILLAVGAVAVLTPRVGGQDIDWLLAERDDVTLWHWQDLVRANELADSAQGAYDLVSDLIDADTSAPIMIVVWPPEADPSDASALPEEIADPQFVRHVTRNTSGDVRNAVSNALIDATTLANAGEVPLWMRIAVGLWSSGPMPGFYLRRAGSVVILDHEQYYTLEQLQTIPMTWQFQAKYFGQVGGMLSWMIQDWGPETLAQLFRSVGEGASFYEAFERHYGIAEGRLVDEFTKNAERALLLTWPYIEDQTPPFFERLNLNHVILVAAAIPLAILLFFVGKRLFYD